MVKCGDYAFNAGSTKQPEETAADSNKDDYENVSAQANDTIGDFQVSTYVQLTSMIQASQSHYTRIDVAGRMQVMPGTPSPDYEEISDI